MRVARAVAGAEINLLRFVGRSAQLNWLVRRHVNLLVSYARE